MLVPRSAWECLSDAPRRRILHKNSVRTRGRSFPPRLMQDWLAARAQTTPQALALIFREQALTYAELNQRVARLCAGLLVDGVVPGQAVAALLPNGVAYVCLVHALPRLGATLVPLNTRLTASELAWQLTQTGAKRLLHDASLAEAAGRATDLTADSRPLHMDALAAEEAAASPSQNHPPKSDGLSTHLFELDAPQAIVFTSGTTGQPKGATLTFANHFWSATASSYRLGLRPDDCWLSCLPLYHVGGLAVLFRSCLYGTAIALHERFDADVFNAALDKPAHERPVTLTSLVPTMLYRLLAMRGERALPSSLRLVLLGGAAAPTELLADAIARGVPVAATYGLTEAASQVATADPATVRRKPGSAGRPLMFTTVRIADDGGASLPAGEIGEVVVSGPTVMSGYHGNADATAHTLRDGELFTGDVGYLDDEGDLWLVQRRSDIIVSGGENVYPTEVEGVLRQHPAVAEACVVGVDDVEWGQRVVALVALAPGGTLSEAELMAFGRARLAGYKQPRLVRFTNSLPQTASGKIARGEVARLMGDVA